MVAQIDLKYFKTRPTKAVSRLFSYALFEGRPVTTRGQWINPFIFTHFAIEKKLPSLKPVKEPLFILGTGRSGTTILGVLLSMHRDVGFLNEPKAMWHSIYPMEDVIGSYSKGEARYRLDSSQADDRVKRNAHRLFGAYLRGVFSNRLVDKYPELVFRVPFVREIFPDAKFIFLVRNGWDTCCSIEEWSKRYVKQSNGEIHDWWGVNQRKWKLMNNELIDPDPYFKAVKKLISSLEKHTDMAVVEWIVTMREGLKRVKQYNDCMCMIRYEDLVASPRITLSDISKFSGLAEDETFFKYGEMVLRKVPRQSEFEIHPDLKPLFDETMEMLGY